nr:hypothetical protein [Chlamydiota bacterium]
MASAVIASIFQEPLLEERLGRDPLLQLFQKTILPEGECRVLHGIIFSEKDNQQQYSELLEYAGSIFKLRRRPTEDEGINEPAFLAERQFEVTRLPAPFIPGESRLIDSELMRYHAIAPTERRSAKVWKAHSAKDCYRGAPFFLQKQANEMWLATLMPCFMEPRESRVMSHFAMTFCHRLFQVEGRRWESKKPGYSSCYFRVDPCEDPMAHQPVYWE